MALSPINLDSLIAAVTAATTVQASTIEWIRGIMAKVDVAVRAALRTEHAENDATIVAVNRAIEGVKQSLLDSSAALAKATVDNTPASPSPAPNPTPSPNEPFPNSNPTPSPEPFPNSNPEPTPTPQPTPVFPSTSPVPVEPSPVPGEPVPPTESMFRRSNR